MVSVQPEMGCTSKCRHNKAEVYHTWGLPDRILTTSWNNVYDVLENPLAFIRASPWDTLKHSSGSSDKSCDINIHLLKKIFSSKLLFDTKADELSGVPESQKFIDRFTRCGKEILHVKTVILVGRRGVAKTLELPQEIPTIKRCNHLLKKSVATMRNPPKSNVLQRNVVEDCGGLVGIAKPIRTKS